MFLNELRKRHLVKKIGAENYNKIVDEIYEELNKFSHNYYNDDVVDVIDSALGESTTCKKDAMFYLGGTAVLSIADLTLILERVINKVPVTEDKLAVYLIALVASMALGVASIKSCRDRHKNREDVADMIMAIISKDREGYSVRRQENYLNIGDCTLSKDDVNSIVRGMVSDWEDEIIFE